MAQVVNYLFLLALFGHLPFSFVKSRIVEPPIRLPVLGASGASVQDLARHAGYVRINHTIGARLFYYFFQSRNKKDDPLVMWLSGGPGCSGAIALFKENGPFFLANNLSLVWNDNGWDKVSNIIFIDQPTGTGYSYSSSDKDIRHDQKGVSDDLYDFMQGFLSQHPEYVKNDFYVAGESYAGHYIPAFATRVNQGNINKNGIRINLKGIAIGNGLTDPGTQFKSAPDFGILNKLINQQDYNRISQKGPKCEEAAKKCETTGHSSCIDSMHICQEIQNEVATLGGKCVYDIRRKDCYSFATIEQFLNTASVKKALGVPPNVKFEACSGVVHKAMREDIMRNLAVGLPEVLKSGINMLVYVGEYDFICNWIGIYRWVKAMKWTGQSGFDAAKVIKFQVDGKEAGLLQNHGPLTFFKVRNAGHMVPMDQPKASLQMLKTWMDGKLK